MKCDETKPSCLRCLRFWGKCEGYPAPKLRSLRQSLKAGKEEFVSSKAVSRPLLPRPQYASDGVILYQDLGGELFRNALEHRYFQIFRNQTVSAMPGLFTSSLWERVILQACHQEEFIRDAAVAIGALSTCGRKLVEDNRAAPQAMVATGDYRFALRQYGRAVKSMRERLSNEEENLRIVLIGCLMVVCFEGLQGNSFQALEHAVAGHKLLQGWLARRSYSQSRKEGIASPEELTVEDDLVQAFSRLDLQVMTYVDPRPLDVHKSLKNEGDETMRQMPWMFENVDEARLYWELVQRRTSHFIACAAAQSADTVNPVPRTLVDMGTGAPLVNFHADSDIYKSIPVDLIPGELGSDYRRYSAEIARWFGAFSLFYDGIKKEDDAKIWAAASLLKIHAKAMEVMLLSALFGNECSLDRFLPSYKEIVSTAKEISMYSLYQSSNYVSFDLGIVNPLRLVGKWCREPTLRREAIRILRESKPREGLYDGLVMAKVQEWVMTIEEEGILENGFIPEESRAKITHVKIDLYKRTAELKCERLGRKEDGSRDERETIIGW